MTEVGGMALQLGATDCEALGGGWLVQPVNAVTSGAYLIAALALATASTSGKAERLGLVLFASATAGVGVGSFLFHGPQPSVARLGHDVGIASVFIVVSTTAAGRRWGWRQWRVLAVSGGALGTTVVVLLRAPNAGLVVILAWLAVALVFEARTWRPTGIGEPLRTPGVATAVVVAGGFNWLGRTDAPLCDPNSWFQGHAVWHVGTALALWWYGKHRFAAAVDR